MFLKNTNKNVFSENRDVILKCMEAAVVRSLYGIEIYI